MEFWTRQAKEVWEELREKGHYHVKKEYIEKKNDTIAEYYTDLYEWYTGAARKYIDIPKEYHYPIWMSLSEDLMLRPAEDAVILRLEVPEGKYLICNYDKWGYRMNYWYVPLDEEDEKKHQAELKRCGIVSEDSLISGSRGNFYPLLKRKIIESWDRIFTIEPKSPELTVGTCWEIEKGWVREVRFYEGENPRSPRQEQSSPRGE